MARTRTFTFTDKTAPEEEQVKEVEARGFKQAVKSYQNSTKAKIVEIEWITKRGENFYKLQTLPLGRKKRLSR